MRYDDIDHEEDLDEKKRSSNKTILVFIVLTLILLAFFGFKVLSSFKLFGKKSAKKQQQIISIETKDFTLPDFTVEEKKKEPKEELLEVPVVANVEVPEEKPLTLTDLRLGADFVKIPAFSVPKKPKAKKVKTEKRKSSNTNIATLLGSSSVSMIKNPSYTLLQGSKLPCVLETKIVSDFAGSVTCILSQDIYSMDARVLLLEKGSKLIGQYGGKSKYGETRVAVVWERIITPFNLTIAIKSFNTDNLGGVALPAHVNNHWFKKIGAALLISFTDDLFEYAKEVEGKKEKDLKATDSNTADTISNIANQVLKETIKVRPTLTVLHGTTINITVDKDIDFSGVYDVR